VFNQSDFQSEFLKTYLEETMAGSSRALSITHEMRQQQAEALQREVEAFFIVPNLLWALWSIAQSVSTKITFGYWVNVTLFKTRSSPCVSGIEIPVFVYFQYYAEERMQYYFHFKESCTSMNIDH